MKIVPVGRVRLFLLGAVRMLASYPEDVWVCSESSGTQVMFYIGVHVLDDVILDEVLMDRLRGGIEYMGVSTGLLTKIVPARF
jgi:hypothetical protein